MIFPETEKATDRKTAENRTRICRREDMKTSTIFLLLVSRLRRDASAQSEMNNHDPNQEQQQVLGRRALAISKPGLTRHPCPIYGSKFRKTLTLRYPTIGNSDFLRSNSSSSCVTSAGKAPRQKVTEILTDLRARPPIDAAARAPTRGRPAHVRGARG